MVDTSEENLVIANIIFNAKIHEINIAVTSKDVMSQELIQERLVEILRRVFSSQNIEELQGLVPLLPNSKSLLAAVKQPVHIINEQRDTYSKGNAFVIGDAAGHSSPLAGMGGTLGLTLVPRTVEQVLNDSEVQPQEMHHNFYEFSHGYTSRWIEKSQAVKLRCLGLFKSERKAANDQEQNSTKENELALVSTAPK